MATSRLTTNEVSFIISQATDYAELGADWRSWCPIKTIPLAETVKAYVNTRVEPPKTSKYGDLSVTVATSKDEHTANTVWLRHKLQYSRQEVAMARRSGYDPLAETARGSLRQINRMIAQIIFQGLDDNVAINGMFDSGEDVDATLDAIYWDTIPNPLTHVREGAKDLISNGFEPPYVMIMGYDLYPGWKALHNAASDLSHDSIAKRDYLSSAYFYEGGTDSGTKIYPLPAASNDDGVWIMTKPHVDNYFVAEVAPPAITIDPVLDRESNSFKGWVEWFGTFLMKRTGSILYEPDVDLAE